ncbi:MAG: DUF3316 domain-containing protein [Prevotella sp.]|nr:DUF3316 domain-containing protein [Prevotella sp.]
MTKKMKSKYACLVFGLFFLSNIFARNRVDTVYPLKTDTVDVAGRRHFPDPLVSNNAVTVAIGSANMYDTYLSPLEYKGTSLRLMYEQMRRTTWFEYKFYKQQVFELDFAKGDNPAKNASEYRLLANYRIGGHYRLYNTDAFRLGIGGLWDINAGALYNERNGNNPATARAYTNLNLSLAASYKFKWFAVRWQMDTPFAGMLFSPKYGQSYYEISLGNTVGIVNFASLHNQRALRNYLTVDVPVHKYIVRVGYLGSWYQTRAHDIQTHHYAHHFVIGFPIESVKRPGKKAGNDYWNGY